MVPIEIADGERELTTEPGRQVLRPRLGGIRVVGRRFEPLLRDAALEQRVTKLQVAKVELAEREPKRGKLHPNLGRGQHQTLVTEAETLEGRREREGIDLPSVGFDANAGPKTRKAQRGAEQEIRHERRLQKGKRRRDRYHHEAREDEGALLGKLHKNGNATRPHEARGFPSLFYQELPNFSETPRYFGSIFLTASKRRRAWSASPSASSARPAK